MMLPGESVVTVPNSGEAWLDEFTSDFGSNPSDHFYIIKNL